MSVLRRQALTPVLALVLGSLLSGGVTAGAAPMRWPGNPFSPSSFWNAPLARHARLSPLSRRYVAALVWQVRRYRAWMNTTSYSVPVYLVPRNQPPQRVTLDAWGPDLQWAFDAVPIPAAARAAAGRDQSMTVWQPSRNDLWEFWHMRRRADGWHAEWGGAMTDVSSNPGYFTHTGLTNDWGATATGLPLLGGLVTFADLRRGFIDHALAIGVVRAQRGLYVWPAQRTDGAWRGMTAIPEGTRFRLDPHVNISRLHLPWIDRVLARAAQRYGLVVRDQAGSVAFFGQDPVTRPGDPWPRVFGHRYPSQVLARFPWARLRALRPRSR